MAEKLLHEDILRYEEILRLVRICVSLGITKVRVTGGEPLVRKEVYDFLRAMAAIDGLSDISLTTNGVFLKNNIDHIRSAGIHRINISLDTLDRHKFKTITGYDLFDAVWEGIQAALKSGFHPIKLNVVALKGINEDELLDFARLSMTAPYHIRFIEYMPIGCDHDNLTLPLLTPDIKRRISALGDLYPIENNIQDGPAERYQLRGAVGEIGFISALSRHFCEACNRLRLTANGQLRTCLLSNQQFDLKGPLRSGSTDAQLADIFLQAVYFKPSRHPLCCDRLATVDGRMSSIGG